jgi:hypothetical protein
MRSIHGSLNQLQPLIDVSIGAPSGDGLHRETYRALVDTGSTRTCITRRVIARFAVEAKAKLLIASATSGPERRRAYGYSLGLFCTDEETEHSTLYVIPHEFIAPWFVDNDNFDVLLGMDILSRGQLIFQPNGAFTFSFSF